MSTPRPFGHIEAWEERHRQHRLAELADEYARRLAELLDQRTRGDLDQEEHQAERLDLNRDIQLRRRRILHGGLPVPDYADIQI